MTAAEWGLLLARSKHEPSDVERLEKAISLLTWYVIQPHLKQGKSVALAEIEPDWWKVKPVAGSMTDLKQKARQLAMMDPARLTNNNPKK